MNSDEGNLIIATFTPAGYEELSRTQLPTPTTSADLGAVRRYDRLVNWSHPSLCQPAYRASERQRDHPCITCGERLRTAPRPEQLCTTSRR